MRPATLKELEILVANLPGKDKLMALLGAWCAMRFGELAELRRSDIDVERKLIQIRRGVAWVVSATRHREPRCATNHAAAGRDAEIARRLSELAGS